MEEDTIPDISKTAFSCPHCCAYTTQHWYTLKAAKIDEKTRVPILPGEENLRRINRDPEIDDETRAAWVEFIQDVMLKLPFFSELDLKAAEYSTPFLYNVNVSECYNCKKISLWVNRNLVFPKREIDLRPNRDMPLEVANLFEEAATIIADSPRGAAALLRLGLQHLCRHLGESGRNIDKDIMSLVSKGLSPMIQQSLDIVRVIGNEAVHPGVIDLNDNRDIAEKLFVVTNLICEQMISHPKAISSLYERLPEEKRKAIAERDKR